MKLTIVLLTAAIFNLQASGLSQTVSLSGKNLTLKQVFTAIEKQTGYVVLTTKSVLSAGRPVTVNVSAIPLSEFLKTVLEDQPLNFRIADKTISLSRKPVMQAGEKNFLLLNNLFVPVTGIVTDSLGTPLEGASVSVKGMKKSVITDKNGRFTIDVTEGQTLIISFVGFHPAEMIAGRSFSGTVKLVPLSKDLGDVVVNTGMFTRKRESFTGATSSFTGEQLRAIGNMNVIQSLKTLDPSFIVLDNNLQGANPNALPNIEIRGKTSIRTTINQFSTDPNLPLFILDGFEASLDMINNLNINNVASVTLLKDAGSAAMYGSKAANGVVVIETKRPVPGEIRINYTYNANLNVPDLGSYNLMNASEKLEFERLSGRYTYDPQVTNSAKQYELDQTYNDRLTQIKRGVNTYWLNEPVRNALTQGHSLQFSGGSKELTFATNLTYRTTDGVMKGSDRKDYSGNIDLNFRSQKFNIINSLYISGWGSNESPYGSFSDFANANPYYPKNYTNPTLDNTERAVPNPLYDATLLNIDKRTNLSFRNNLRAKWSLTNDFQIEVSGLLQKEQSNFVQFIPPEHSTYIGNNTNIFQRGEYTKTISDNFQYQARLTATYAKVFNDVHQFTANLQSDIQNNKRGNVAFGAVGFPEGTNGNLIFAYSYEPDKAPASASDIYRGINSLVSVNYSYDRRYLLDFTYKLDGSTSFGSNKKYSPFWSAGLGWNLQYEKYFRNITWISRLKVYGNIGVTGNQNFGSNSSSSIYTFLPGNNQFGQSLDMTGLGNPNLQWQNTRQTSLGVDVSLWQNRLSGTLNYYTKLTDPLVINTLGSVPSSTGVAGGYPINIGMQKGHGWEWRFNYSPVYRVKDRIIWTIGVTGAVRGEKYDGFGSRLNTINKNELANKSLVRYNSGYSPDDIWAVPSLGIDPASGNEIFLKKDGTRTFTYDAVDIVKVGNSRPKVEGVVSQTLTIKNLSVSAYFRYRAGGDVFNTALYSKVENISRSALIYNQDKRALYGRWQKPGDIAEFKSIALTNTTPMSSRFVQRENVFFGESLSLAYNFPAEGWMKTMRMSSLNVSLIVNNLFRFESVKSERGIDYPFANTYSLRIMTSF